MKTAHPDGKHDLTVCGPWPHVAGALATGGAPQRCRDSGLKSHRQLPLNVWKERRSSKLRALTF